MFVSWPSPQGAFSRHSPCTPLTQATLSLPCGRTHAALGSAFPVPANQQLERLGGRNFWPLGFGQGAKGEPMAAGGRGLGALHSECLCKNYSDR